MGFQVDDSNDEVEAESKDWNCKRCTLENPGQVCDLFDYFFKKHCHFWPEMMNLFSFFFVSGINMSSLWRFQIKKSRKFRTGNL